MVWVKHHCPLICNKAGYFRGGIGVYTSDFHDEAQKD